MNAAREADPACGDGRRPSPATVATSAAGGKGCSTQLLARGAEHRGGSPCAGEAGAEVHPAGGPGDARSGVDHGLCDAQPRAHGVRHAVRAGQQLPATAADGRRATRSSADGKQWDITLRDGLMFHDGSAVLARDCVASIQRWWQRDGVRRRAGAATDEVSAPSDKHIRFRLKKPFPLLPDALGGRPPTCAASCRSAWRRPIR